MSREELAQAIEKIPDIQERLDDLVHEMKSLEATAINNSGPDEQLTYLLTQFSATELLVEIENG